MTLKSLHRATLAAALIAAALAPAARAQPAAPGAEAHAQSAPTIPQSWANDPHMHAFYEATVAAFANGPDKVDAKAYEAKCTAIFRDFGVAHHMDAAKIYEGTRRLPGQVIQIVRDDPKVLDSYQNFVDATAGPA